MSSPCKLAAASTIALPCSLISMAVFLLAYSLRSFSADSISSLTSFSLASRKIRSRRADEVLISPTARSSSSTYMRAMAAARLRSLSVTLMTTIWLFLSTEMSEWSSNSLRASSIRRTQ